ncbi:MAG: hypothetical protein NEA02_11855 [Thermoanaerobaculia bacterium]|nr:hypothetical protein [Thermoanaerobaculia bacterium]
MTTRRTFALLALVSLLPATLAAAPTAVEFQGVTIGSKLRTTPVDFKTKVGLVGGGFLAPGSYDVEVASTGDKSRVMLLFFQKGRKMGETPGVLKLGQGVRGGVGPSCKTGIVRPNCNNAGGVERNSVKEFCIAGNCPAKICIAGKGGGQATSKGYLTFEQLGFAGGVKPSLRAGAGGGTLLTIPGAGGASVEAQLPAAH